MERVGELLFQECAAKIKIDVMSLARTFDRVLRKFAFANSKSCQNRQGVTGS